jgi:hypothetical protein
MQPFATKARKLKWNVYAMETSHDVMITHPNELAEILLRIANSCMYSGIKNTKRQYHMLVYHFNSTDRFDISSFHLSSCSLLFRLIGVKPQQRVLANAGREIEKIK